MEYLIDRFDRITDLSTASENVIIINGGIKFSAQFASFQTQLSEIDSMK